MKIKNFFLTFMTLFLVGCSSGNNLSNSAMTSEGEQTSEPIEAPEECVYKGIKYKKDDTAYSVIGYTDVIESNSVIKSEICNLPVTMIKYYAFDQCYALSSIEIPNSVTSIGDGAFFNCSSLTSITIPNSVTSIGSQAFYDCSSLETVTFEEGSQLISIAREAFLGCSLLTSITIPNSVTSIGSHAFHNCSSLETVTFEEGSQLTSFGSEVFYNCSSLEFNEYDNAYYLGNSENPYLVLVTAKDTSITSCAINEDTRCIAGDAFAGCSSLTSIVIPSSVTSIGRHAFYGCSSLTIYCEADSQPSGWNSNWNSFDCPVVWGYEGE